MRSKNWQAVTVGQLSGNRRVIPWLQWRREHDARQWCEQENARLRERPYQPLIVWEYERIE